MQNTISDATITKYDNGIRLFLVNTIATITYKAAKTIPIKIPVIIYTLILFL